MPLDRDCARLLKKYLCRLCTEDETPLFPSEADSSKPADRWFMSRRLRWAYERAGLEPLQGGLWHPFRRKFATERKNMSVIDVAQAGGWKETRTLLECYQQPDQATLQQVVLGAPKLRSDGLGVDGKSYSNSHSNTRRNYRPPAA